MYANVKSRFFRIVAGMLLLLAIVGRVWQQLSHAERGVADNAGTGARYRPQ